MAPWVGYIRVSSVGGRKGDRFHSPDEQAAAIQAWADRQGQAVVVLEPELDESGGRADRPKLTEAVEGIEQGRYAGLVVAYMSRAMRSTKHLLAMWDRIEDAGGHVVTIRENIDTSTATGRMQRTMLAAIDEHELDIHRERFANLRESATARGIWQRRQTPTGYRRDDETRKLVPDERADEVRCAFRDRAAGRPLTQVATELEMTTSGARQLLRNRVYLGELHVGEHVNKNAHPPLVDEALFLAAQAQAGAPRPGRGQAEPALLASLVRCCGCSHVMTRGSSGTRKVYGCPTRHSLGRCAAPATVTVDLLDRHVEDVALRELAQLAATATDDGDALDEARATLRKAEGELEAFLEAVDTAGIGSQTAAAAIRSRTERIETARETVERIAASQAAAPAGAILDEWPRLTIGERNHVLRGLLDCVLVERSGGRGVIRPLVDRVRVVRFGAGVAPPAKRGGNAIPLAAIRLPDADDPAVLRVAGP